jgi:hypothetical protein
MNFTDTPDAGGDRALGFAISYWDRVLLRKPHQA